MYIHVCGPYGYKNNQTDGATVKTRLLTERLNVITGEAITYTDTQNWRSAPLKMIFGIVGGFLRSHYVIMLAGSRGLTFLLPFYVALSLMFKSDLRYVVLGGWLPDLLAKRKSLRYLCKKISGIYVETKSMKSRLEECGMKNVKILSNFRYFDITRSYSDKNDSYQLVRLLYYSRVTREKGVESAINAAKMLNSISDQVTLDIYGPIDPKFEADFYKLLTVTNHGITYRGVLDPNDPQLYRTLSEYDIMLFPTFYPGEGFPGAIIDSYIAGVPVIASDWKYNHEIITDGKTGYLFDLNTEDSLIEKVLYLINNRESLYTMKGECFREARMYHTDVLLRWFLSDIGYPYDRGVCKT